MKGMISVNSDSCPLKLTHSTKKHSRSFPSSNVFVFPFHHFWLLYNLTPPHGLLRVVFWKGSLEILSQAWSLKKSHQIKYNSTSRLWIFLPQVDTIIISFSIAMFWYQYANFTKYTWKWSFFFWIWNTFKSSRIIYSLKI